MKQPKLLLGIALFGVLFAVPTALAVDVTDQGQSSMSKRQIPGCMTKRMLADKALSYNDARKACTAMLKAQTAGVAHPLTAATRPGL